jgi:hypothetical protein
MKSPPNKIAPHEPPLPDSSSSAEFIGRWIRCQRLIPAAVGEL